MTTRRGAIAALAILFVAAVVPEVAAHKPTVTTFTYHRDVSPIFAAKCGSCHRSGGIAPMSLLSYEEAYPWAVSIKNELLNLRMPPWFVDERYGDFAHPGGLTATEMNTIVDWCLGGSPEGEPSGRAASPAASDWPLGEPDFELTMSEAFVLDAESNEAFHDVVMEPALESARLIRAFDFLPGSANILRSVLVYRGDGERSDGDLLAVWLPGERAFELTRGRGYRLRPGERLTLRLHYKKTWLDEGTEVSDRSVLGVYLQPETDASNEVTTLVVEAGSSRALEHGVEVLALVPRLDGPAASLEAEAVRPDGTRERLIRLHQPDPAWPRKFWLRSPLSLPAGSTISLKRTGADTGSESMEAVLLLDVVSR